MKLSEKDKKLLLILAILVIVCVPYFFVISPAMDRMASLEKEISSLKSDVSYRESLALGAGDYAEKTVAYAVAKEEMISQFPSDLLQEASLLFIHNTEQIIPISLYQVSFGDDVATQITSDAQAQAIDEVEVATGDVTQDQVIADNTQTSNIGGGLTGIQTQTRFAYEAGYTQFKDFLKYIMDYHDRMVITDLEAAYSGEMELVAGNFTLSQYALKGEGRNKVKYLEPNMIQGTTNVFKQASGVFDVEETDVPDFFILLNQPEADLDAVVVGRADDTTESSYLTSAKNSTQEVNIYFKGEDGNYNAYYEIGKAKFDEEGIDFHKEGNIELQIVSSRRLNDNDDVAIKLNIVNETDCIVKVKTINDDEEMPRVNIKGMTGDVIVQ